MCLDDHARPVNLDVLPPLLTFEQSQCETRIPSKLTSVSLFMLHVTANDLAQFVRDANFLTKFYMVQCTILPGTFTTDALAARHVAQSFASTSSSSILS